MRFSSFPGVFVSACGLLAAVSCLSAQPPAPEAPAPRVVQGIPPRTAPTEYISQGTVGKITIGAEFMGHSVPTPQATFTTEEYVCVEVGLFAAPGTKLVIKPEQFSLRVNGKKQALPSQAYELIFHHLKDPEWEAAQAIKAVEKSKTSLNGSGGGGGGLGGGGQEDKPAPPKMKIEERRAMEAKVLKASFPEGDRPLPQAGLLYFQYGGKTKGLKSLELLYEGPAGKAAIALQP